MVGTTFSNGFVVDPLKKMYNEFIQETRMELFMLVDYNDGYAKLMIWNEVPQIYQGSDKAQAALDRYLDKYVKNKDLRRGYLVVPFTVLK